MKHLLLEDRLTPDDEFRWLNLHREPVKHEKIGKNQSTINLLPVSCDETRKP